MIGHDPCMPGTPGVPTGVADNSACVRTRASPLPLPAIAGRSVRSPIQTGVLRKGVPDRGARSGRRYCARRHVRIIFMIDGHLIMTRRQPAV
jgi:hypothetical protein